MAPQKLNPENVFKRAIAIAKKARPTTSPMFVSFEILSNYSKNDRDLLFRFRLIL